MTKTKDTDSRFPLIVTGYILFTLLIVAVLLSTTIPFGKMLLNPRVLHFNVAVFTVALTIGSLLPAFLGYIIGDRSIKTKSKVRHHFNGVLFGLLAYWVMSVLSLFVSIPSEYLASSPNARVVLINLLPSVAVAIISALLTIAHVRGRQAKHDIVEYKPYSAVLIAFIILMPVVSLISNVFFSLDISVYSFIPLAILIFFGGISYATLRNSSLSMLDRVTWSAVSVSVAFVAIFVLSQFISGLSYYIEARPTMEFQTIISSVAWILALTGWCIYWFVQVKALPGKR